MLRKDNHGLVTYQFENLAAQPLTHAVFTRLGGVSHAPFATLNVGSTVGDDPAAVTENCSRIRAHLQISARQIATPFQTHSNRVAVVQAGDGGQVFANTDGLATRVAGIVLLLRFADCQPILLYDPVQHALALIHAGWRGVALGIAHRGVETMQEAFGTEPQDLIAGLGPAIGPCCYTVGDKVAAAIGYVLPDWNQAMHRSDDGWQLDLSAANAQQLAAAGVGQVEQAGLCTACHRDEFFSHRGDHGQTGRFAVAAFLASREEGLEGYPAQENENSRGGPEPAEADGQDSLAPPGFPTFQELLGDEP